MTDETKRNLHREKRVSLRDDDVRDWCEELGCTERELVDAVNAVGDSAEAVRGYLSARRSSKK